MAKQRSIIMHNQRGFSIIEVILVVGIMGAVLAISVPNVKKTLEMNQKRQFEYDSTMVYNILINKFDMSFEPAFFWIYNGERYTPTFPFCKIKVGGNCGIKNVDDIDYDVLCGQMLCPAFKKIPGFDEITYSFERVVINKKTVGGDYGTGVLHFKVKGKGDIILNTRVFDFEKADRLILSDMKYVLGDKVVYYQFFQNITNF